MAKKKKKSNANGARAGGAWGRQEQEARINKHLRSMVKNCEKKGEDVEERLANKGYKRTKLSHDTQEIRENKRLKLHISHVQRQLDELRKNLEQWDELEETEKRRKAEQEELKRRDEIASGPPTIHEIAARMRFKRYHPSNWKLRGAARPAWEVYDFDTRYVCPHQQAFKDSAEKAKRLQNIFSLFRGKFASENAPQPQCRNYLSLLNQFGLLNLEAKRFKSARMAFKECMELEGNDPSLVVSPARCRLMRMYLENNRPDEARKLFQEIPDDTSAWIQYSAALVEYVSWKLLGEEGSSEQQALEQLSRAIKSNVFCAYHLAFSDTFSKFIEYSADIEDGPEGTLEEAIEYCASEQMNIWIETEGAIDWIKSVVLTVLNGTPLTQKSGIIRDDLEWEKKLSEAEEDFRKYLADQESKTDDEKDSYPVDKNQSDDKPETEDSKVDFLLYSSMFRAAVDATGTLQGAR